VSINDITYEQAKALARGEFGRELMRVADGYTSYVFWCAREEDGSLKILSNGTVFFINTGTHVFGVTAAHVVRGYLKSKQEHKKLGCQIGNTPIDLESRLIAINDQVDIATFSFSPDEIKAERKRALEGSQSAWPPAPPEIEKGIFFAGFPGVERQQQRLREVSMGLYYGAGTATSVSTTDVSCLFERENWVDTLGQGLPPVGYDMGGCSGGPVFTVVDSRGVMTWRLAGVIYEFPSSSMEILKARRADFILPDGQINPLPY